MNNTIAISMMKHAVIALAYLMEVLFVIVLYPPDFRK
jgi:hypothetical protein